MSFNPHSRMGSDIQAYRINGHIPVSIHTPAWGVTPSGIPQGYLLQVSIHTPAWGVTTLDRPHDTHTVVSIHTPAWGVTQ